MRRIGFVFQEYYALILNRLRLEAKGDLAPGLELDLQYDNELLLGSYLGTAEFRSAKDSAAPQYWRADANDLERGDLYGRHRPYRAAVTLTRGNVDLKLGRQRIAWGTGRFWESAGHPEPGEPAGAGARGAGRGRCRAARGQARAVVARFRCLCPRARPWPGAASASTVSVALGMAHAWAAVASLHVKRR